MSSDNPALTPEAIADLWTQADLASRNEPPFYSKLSPLRAALP